MITLDDAHSWLNRYIDNSDYRVYEINTGKTYLEPSVRQLLDKMNEAKNIGNQREVWSTKSRLQKLCEKSINFIEEAEACVECACLMYLIGDFFEASNLLDKAAKRYSGVSHNAGVAHWMRGYILWQIPNKHDDAIVAWRNATNLFYRSLDRNKYALQLCGRFLDLAQRLDPMAVDGIEEGEINTLKKRLADVIDELNSVERDFDRINDRKDYVEDLQNKYLERKTWYENRITEMEQAICDAIEIDGIND